MAQLHNNWVQLRMGPLISPHTLSWDDDWLSLLYFLHRGVHVGDIPFAYRTRLVQLKPFGNTPAAGMFRCPYQGVNVRHCSPPVGD